MYFHLSMNIIEKMIHIGFELGNKFDVAKADYVTISEFFKSVNFSNISDVTNNYAGSVVLSKLETISNNGSKIDIEKLNNKTTFTDTDENTIRYLENIVVKYKDFEFVLMIAPEGLTTRHNASDYDSVIRKIRTRTKEIEDIKAQNKYFEEDGVELIKTDRLGVILFTPIQFEGKKIERVMDELKYVQIVDLKYNKKMLESFVKYKN